MNINTREERGEMAEWNFQNWIDSLSSEALIAIGLAIGLPSRSVKEPQLINWQKEGF